METWKPVIGFEKIYSVSNLGNIKSHDRESIKTYRGVITGTVKVKGKDIKKMTNACGYYCVDVVKKNMLVHRLVALNFIPNPNNYKVINHKDGNKQNNNVNNLEWCTHKQNSIHASKHNLYNPRRGELNNMAKLTEKDVLDIRLSKDTGVYLASKYNVDKSLISSIRLRKSWKHI